VKRRIVYLIAQCVIYGIQSLVAGSTPHPLGLLCATWCIPTHCRLIDLAKCNLLVVNPDGAYTAK
jgi:hypothetical protein